MRSSFTSKIFILLSLFFFTYTYSQSVCDVVTPVCSNENFAGDPPAGNPGGTIDGGCQNLEADDVTWYYIRIQSGNVFTFQIEPDNPGDDYDFAVWLNADCNNLGEADRASYSIPYTGITGLIYNETDVCEGAGGGGVVDEMVRHLDVVPGDEIIIAVDKYSDFGDGFTLVFNESGGNTDLDCTIVGENYGQCDYDGNNQEVFDLDIIADDITEGNVNQTVDFYEDEVDAQDGNANTETSPYTVTFNDTDGDGLDNGTVLYGRVEENGVFIRVVQITLFVNRPPVVTSPVNLDPKCDILGDGAEIFDLTEAESLLVTDPTLYIFTYYEDFDDADSGNTNFINPANAYSSGTNTIYVRVETGALVGNEDGCYTVGEINLELQEFGLDTITLNPDAFCDENGDGEVVIDLTQYESQLVLTPYNPEDFIITYYENATDATIPTNNIADPENFPITAGSNDVIYVRIEHPTNGCFIISEIHLSTTVRPVVNLVDDVAVCVDETTGDYLFDLTIFDDQIVTNPLDYNITYHESQADADSGDNPITPENAYPVAINSTPVTVYIRVEADGCPNVGTVEIVVNSNPVLNENLEIETICDEDGDGEIIVDLTENESYFMGTDPGPFEISYHTDQLEAETGTNPILNSTNYTIVAGATEVIYIRVKYQQNTCYSIRTITYTTVERPVLNELDDVTECVDQTDGTIPYDLSVFDSQIIADPQNYDISYYLSLEDAQLSQNPITNYQNYPVPVNVSTEIFIRVEAGGCADFRSVIITFNSNPVVNDLDNQAFCSTEVSGTIPYDLTQHQPEWVNDDPANYIFSYHTSQSDADLDQNPILNSGNYPVTVGITTEIYVRIENPVTGCYTTTILTLYPGTTATLLDNLELALCDDNFDEVFIYDLTELNEQLITNSNNYDFDYYTSLSEAQDNTNPIPQTQWNAYNINSLPFEIWVVATTTDECKSEPVRVRFIQGDYIDLINAVIGPITYCIEDVINLEEFEPEITTENAVFSYHNTLNDAGNGTNPIANTEEFHPEGNNSVYVRLEMEGRCPVIAEIQFELLPTPSLELNHTSFELCPGSSFEALATSDDPNATFIWYLNDTEIGTGDQLSITENGTYTVIVTGSNGCVNEETLIISTPPTPVITGIEIGPDYIIVSADSGDGGGMLEYSLDGVLWQNNPKFSNLTPGEVYTVYVREDGCFKTSYEVVILSISNVVSPNNDGKNDTWEIRGIDVTPDATIKIFDRYGKIFVDTNFEGNYFWDGKYLGNNVPSGDYWFIINIPSDGIIVERRFVGHITVRNQ